MQTKYAPKRQHLFSNGMVARTQLAALDHNANTGRQQATVSRGANQGELQYKVVFPKNTKEWVAKPIFEKTTNYHLKPMLNAIVERKCLKPQERSATVTAPHFSKPHVIATLFRKCFPNGHDNACWHNSPLVFSQYSMCPPSKLSVGCQLPSSREQEDIKS